MSRSLGRPSALTLAAVLAFTLTGCPSQDVDGADAASVLTDAGAPEEVADCLGDRFDDDLTQDQINEVGGADDLADLDQELQDEVQTILTDCISSDGESTGDSSETTEPADESGDETTTTTAGE
jgi:hypothetical protein